MESIVYPRVLIISHNILSDTNNMGKTMSDFFREWDSEQLAQLYFHSETPTSEICNNYYRITDFDMVKAITKFQKPGTLLKKTDIDKKRVSARVDSGVKAKVYEQFGPKRKPYTYVLRNTLWATKRWKTKDLENWIDDFNPEVIFFASGDYSFSIKIALEISKERNLPLVTYFGDEFYFLETSSRYSFFNWLNRKTFKKSVAEMFAYLSTFTVASDKLKEKYENHFHKKGHAIMTATEVSKGPILNKTNEEIKISYIGNIGLNRWKSLIEIGHCIKDEGYVIDLYSMDTDPAILPQMTKENGICFHGSISPKEVKKVIKESTIVIHVESFDELNKQLTQYSMSTKIGDSLGSGVGLFAYGPSDVASIEYLVENEVACVATHKDELKSKIMELISNHDLRNKYINNALQLASRRHNANINPQLFNKMINEAVKK